MFIVESKMSKKEIRYMFEHGLLPRWFFETTKDFVRTMLTEPSEFFDNLDRMFEWEMVENPYTMEQFQIEHIKLTEDIMVLKLTFPEPEEAPFCYNSFAIYDEKFEKIRYFCIERANGEDSKEAFVCQWTKDERHINHGTCVRDEKTELERCVEIYGKEE